LAESEELVKLKRLLKGLLNRLSEQNIASILDGVEEAYRKHRRADVSSALTTLIIDGIAAHANLLDSYVALNAALVAALHKIVGIEFGAHFVQHLVAAYESHYGQSDESPRFADREGTDDIGGKEAANLLVLLTELYNFQVVSCILIYDIIRSLLDGDLREVDVELLLKITRSECQLSLVNPEVCAEHVLLRRCGCTTTR
jgi:nucleolar MIF4G domain-containing protein 1